jgi:hypothetical protein
MLKFFHAKPKMFIRTTFLMSNLVKNTIFTQIIEKTIFNLENFQKNQGLSDKMELEKMSLISS